MHIRLDGKLALVTGASSGIGQGIALGLADAGADVVVVYHRGEAGAADTVRQIEEMGRRAWARQCDVGDSAAVERLFADVDAFAGTVDILVNNSGIGEGGLVVDMSDDLWERVLRTNLSGPFYCSRAAVQRMLRDGRQGRVINVTSVHEEACGPGAAAYNASKGGLRNFSRTLAVEVAEHGITVNVVAPGMILTPMNGRAQRDPEYLAYAEALIPSRRAGVPADIAHMCVFLASEQASYCTGMTHFVDGGWMLTQPPV
jgi:glucose 1-dehydrogenase